MTNNTPPTIRAPTAEEAYLVTTVAVGVFETYGGGLLARFGVESGESQLLAFSCSDAFELRDQFLVAMTHFAKHGYARDSNQRVLPLPAEDFETAVHVSVGEWFLQMGSNGALWRMTSRCGSNIVLFLTPAQMDGLLFEVECAIEHVVFIDTRPFNGMRWLQLSRVLEEQPGFALSQKLQAFDFSKEVFRRNAHALATHLEMATGPLRDDQVRWDRRFEIDTFVEDAIHHLFNFVASAKALADHSRAFYKRNYEPRKVLEQYPVETKARFAEDGLVQFVHKLRDLMLHVSLVGLIHQTRFAGGLMLGSVLMDRDSALVWDGWTAVPRRWLREGPPELDLLETVKAYVLKINTFQAWYMVERDRIDRRDLRYAEQLRKLVLARRGLEQVPKLGTLLALKSDQLDRVRETVGQLLNAEQLFDLRHDEPFPERWLPRALDIARDSYFISLDMCDALVRHFAPGATPPSQMPHAGGRVL